ncbi:Eco57I restriction-modification methylase domain-containing protein [Candidatus Hodarchaeum mangrovi]
MAKYSTLKEQEKKFIAYLKQKNWTLEESIVFTIVMLLLSVVPRVEDCTKYFNTINDIFISLESRTESKYSIKALELLRNEILELNLLEKMIDESYINPTIQNFQFDLDEQNDNISPSILTKIMEEYDIPHVSLKKKGRFYTNQTEANFIAKLSLIKFYKLNFGEFTKNPSWIFNEDEIPPFEDSSKNQIPKLSKLSILDPACGTGVFILSIIRNLKVLLRYLDIKKLKLWGIDLESKALLITRIRVYLFNFLYSTNYQIITKNCDLFSADLTDEFDIILGNPPWIRHEDLNVNSIIQSLQDKLNDKQHPWLLLIDKKSDLYIYFCIYCASILKNKGVLGFLTSNAWLEVRYGKSLQNYLIKPQNMILQFEIIQYAKQRLWKNLGINSVILFIEKKFRSSLSKKGVFTLAKVPFDEIPFDSFYKGQIIEHDYEDEFYRKEMIDYKELGKNNKWAGSFLRMNVQEREIVRKLNSYGVPLSSIATIKFGIKTGANDFFHFKLVEKISGRGVYRVKNEAGFDGEIEIEFLSPLIKSPTDIKGFVVSTKKNLSYWLLNCNLPPSDIRDMKVEKLIKFGENSLLTIKQGKKSGSIITGFHNLKSLKKRNPWYSIPSLEKPSLLWCKSYHDRPGCIINHAKCYHDQRFYSIIVKEEFLPIIFIFLNSSLVWALMELYGNTNMG